MLILIAGSDEKTKAFKRCYDGLWGYGEFKFVLMEAGDN